MSVLTRSSIFVWLQRFVGKPISIFACMLIVVAALTQLAGRTTLYFASEFTPQLNALLASKRIQLEGVSAQWNGLNPVLRVARVTFGPGQLQGLEIELDMLESLVRTAWIPRHVFWQKAQVHFDQTPKGWQLRNQRELRLPFDVVTSLRHVDHLFGNAQFLFHPQVGETVAFKGDIRARNRRLEHLVEIAVSESRNQAAELRASWLERTAWFENQVVARDLGLEGQLNVPAGILGTAAWLFDSENTTWRQHQDRGHGQLRLVARALSERADVNALPLELALDINLAGTAGRIDGMSEVFSLSSGRDTDARSIDLAPLHVQVTTPVEPSVPTALVWTQGFDIEAVSDVLRTSAGIWPIFSEWLQALAPSGRINSVHGFVDAQGSSGYSASISDLSARGYRGSPSLDNAQGRLWGGGRNIAMQLNADDVALQFPDVFAAVWPFEHVQGLVKFHIQPGILGLRGQNIKARRHGSAIAAQFGVIRPKERYEQRLTVVVSMDKADAQNIPDYVSTKMTPELQNWLITAPRAGKFYDLLGAYHGQVRLRDRELGRRLELVGKVRDGRVQYDPRWPQAVDVSADIHLAGRTTTVDVDSARMAGASFSNSRIDVSPGGRVVGLQFEAASNAGDMLNFIRTTPLQMSLPFVTANWEASGELRMQGQMSIPIAENSASELAVELDFAPQKMSLSLPEYRFEMDDLNGQGAFTLPHQLEGEFAGQLFGNSASVAVTNDDESISFAVTGNFAPNDIYSLTNVSDMGLMQGESQFEALLELAIGEGVSTLSVDTDLQGMAVKLPGEFGKPADRVSPSRFDLQFLDDFQSLRWLYQNTQGWVHLGDEILRGSIGLGTAPVTISANQGSVSIAGELASVDIDEWISVTRGGGSLGIDWQMNDVRVGELRINELAFSDLLVSGRQRSEELVFSARGEALTGQVDLSDPARLGINLQYLRLPEFAPMDSNTVNASVVVEGRDPLSVALGRELPAASVAIEQLDVGDEAYGNWQFEIEPQQDAVHFVALDADFRGVHLRDAVFKWDLSADETTFAGRVDLDDLAQTLPLWDYAPTLETSIANLQVDLAWPGSPPNIELLALRGGMDFKAKDGRFLDADTSANGLRLISLFTPSALAKRINKFDFSDIVDEGMSFERLSAKVSVGQGEMVFTERMILESPSSSFEFGGRVNLRSEALDNEMIVTLPVSNSLPWYAAYLALANPVAGLGVILGEQILRKPIQQFSSAKFAITGTLNDPEVKFVSLWDKSMKAVPQPGSLAPVMPTSDTSTVSDERESNDGDSASKTLAPKQETKEVRPPPQSETGGSVNPA